MLRVISSTLLLILIGAVSFVAAQVKSSVVPGDVVSVSADKIVVKGKDGNVLDAVISAKTEYKRVAAEKPEFSTAAAAAFTDINVGDSVVITGVLSEDKKTMPVKTVYLMTKSDINQKHAKDVEQWRTRGIAGKVASVNTQTNQVTVEVRGLTGTTNLVLTPKPNANFKRYAPNSIRFDEAKDSNLEEIKAGDMLRALGDKSSDGASFAAEQIVTGAFQTVAGTVKSVDAEKNEVVITDLNTKKEVTVMLTGAVLLKKFPAEQAERMAGMQMAMNGGGGDGPRPPGSGAPQGQGQGQRPAGQGNPNGGGQGAGPQRQFGMRPGGAAGGSIDEMLDRFPNITAADLKAGEMIAVSSTKAAAGDKIKAIKFLAGVEPFLRMAQAGANRPNGQRGGGADFNIPGLDGIGFP